MSKRIERIHNYRYPVSQPTVFDEQELTVLELVSKVAYKINETVGEVNSWIEYLDDFVEAFDKELQSTVTETLTKWQDSGLLDVIIDEALQTQMDVLEDETHAKLGMFETQMEVLEDDIHRKLDENVLYASNYINSNANFYNQSDGFYYVDNEFKVLSDINTIELQQFFDLARDLNSVKIVVDIPILLLEPGVKIYLYDCSIDFHGEVYCYDGGSIKLTPYVHFYGNNGEVNNFRINGQREINNVNTSRGTQGNFWINESAKNITFNGGHSLNALQNHCVVFGENITFNNFYFNSSGEHGLYVTNAEDKPRKLFTMNDCVIENWGLGEWPCSGVTFRDYKYGYFNGCSFDGNHNTNAYYGINTAANYRVTQEGDVKISVKNCNFKRSLIAFKSDYHLNIMEDCETICTPFHRQTGVKRSVLRNVVIMNDTEKPRGYFEPAHIHENCEIRDPWMWTPRLASKWINCTWVGNQFSLDKGGRGRLMIIESHENHPQQDFINCTFKDMAFDVDDDVALIVDISPYKNMYNGLTYINCGNIKAIRCNTGSTVINCKDIDNTGVRLDYAHIAHLITNNNLSGYTE